MSYNAVSIEVAELLSDLRTHGSMQALLPTDAKEYLELILRKRSNCRVKTQHIAQGIWLIEAVQS